MKILKRVTFLILTLMLDISVYAQLVYPITGIYKKKSAQGMAIYNDTAFLFNDGGMCRVFNLKTEKIIREFVLASGMKDNHTNSASFSDLYKSEIGYPLIYISECYNRGRCFVECIMPDSSKLVQTIQAIRNNSNRRSINWVVHNKMPFIYAISRNANDVIDSVGNVRVTITKYRLPRIDEGAYVELSEEKIIEEFDVAFPNILQGCIIHNDYLYIAVGLQESLGYRKDSKRAIQVIDLKRRKLTKTIDLTYVTTNEPEDLDFYKGKCLLYCGQEGGIYEIKIK